MFADAIGGERHPLNGLYDLNQINPLKSESVARHRERAVSMANDEKINPLKSNTDEVLSSPVATEVLRQASTDIYHQKKFRRDAAKRVFVNRSLQMQKIKFIGFDMDYTLAEYKTPEFEELAYEHVIERLIAIGYPEQIREFAYTSHFPVRGLWFDMEYGNLLKVDAYGNILVGLHGYHFMSPSEIEEFYPNKFVNLTDRIYVLNTLFNVPETHLLAAMINFFDNCAASFKRCADSRGVFRNEEVLTYKSIFHDIRSVVDWVHLKGKLKQVTVDNIDKYVVKDPMMGEMLKRLSVNAKVFLLTNSDWRYSDKIMTYILGEDWRAYFDAIIVDARKPMWFADGTVFRQVDTETGALRIGMHTGSLQKGAVYSGGSCEAFTRMMRARGKDVLYVGDHIFGDVLRSKKSRGWRTMLIVPELERELRVWTDQTGLFDQLQALDVMMGETYKDMDSASQNVPNISKLTQAIREVTHQMDQAYGMLGSLFRSGSRSTFFASQMERFADLYSASCVNLIYYPHTYFFRAPPMLLPHESTVEHRNPNDVLAMSKNGQRTFALVVEETYDMMRKSKASNVAAFPDDARICVNRSFERARTPQASTFVHEDDQDHQYDSDSSNKKPTPPSPLSKEASVDCESHNGDMKRQHKDSESQLEDLANTSGTEDIIKMSKAVVDR